MDSGVSSRVGTFVDAGEVPADLRDALRAHLEAVLAAGVDYEAELVADAVQDRGAVGTQDVGCSLQELRRYPAGVAEDRKDGLALGVREHERFHRGVGPIQESALRM